MTRDIGELYSSSHAKDKLQNRSHVLKVTIPDNSKTEYSILIALCGDRNDQESNFIQPMKLCGIDDSNVMKHLEKSTDKYTCHQVQDEMIHIMALHHTFRKISADFSVGMYICYFASIKWFTIIVKLQCKM